MILGEIKDQETEAQLGTSCLFTKQMHIDPGYTIHIHVHVPTIVHGERSWPHPLNCVYACVRLLFEGGYYFFRTALGAASIRVNTVSAYFLPGFTTRK
jgi:hypothetical protein